jgi:HEAT repeat protein
MTELTLEDYIVNLNSPAADVRRNAAWILGRSRDIRIIEPLIAALNDPDTTVRVRVAESLGNLRDERTIPPLIAAAQQEADDEVRAQLIASLGRQGDSQIIDHLLTALQDDSVLVRGAAAEALVAIPDQRAIPALIQVLLEENDSNTRYHASRALGNIGGQATTEALIAALTQNIEPQPDRKIALIEILGQLRDRRTVDALRNLLNDPDEGVVETAKWALRQAGAG